MRNSPSDGFERHVANGLEVTYTPVADALRPGTATIATLVTGAKHSCSGLGDLLRR